MKKPNEIQLNNWVVLYASDGKKVLGCVGKNGSARIGRRKRKLSALVGCQWGEYFAVKSNDTLQPIPDEGIVDDNGDEQDMSTARNNQFLNDCTKNQKLGQDAILELKERGIEGEELVQTVVKNSSTFNGKTPFSQEKYLKRKRAKFDLKVRVLRPTGLTLCETYFDKSPEKTLHLRPDALGMLLSFSGIRSGARVLVYENCTGLITASIAERLNGIGRIMNIFTGNTPPGTEIIRMLNLDPKQTKTIVNTPVELLGCLDINEPEDDEPMRYMPREQERDAEQHQPNAKRAEAIAQRAKRGTIKTWLKNGCDCLVVATRYDVVQLFDKLLKYVAPSGCFAAYCMHLQDAADLQYALQLSKMAVRVELTEMSLVNHQILPGRCHPAMTDSATGGYIVSGIRVCCEALGET